METVSLNESIKPVQRAILLMGPTASGKTAAAIELTARFPLEIISVDSAMVYQDMNIGTAKPDAATLAAAPHHLIDLITPEQSYSAARFHDDALAVMADIQSRGKIPVLTGGTMLYFRALREGLSVLPQADRVLRMQIEQEAVERGWPAMHAELVACDPQVAAGINPFDAQRIQRALEVFRMTGQPMSWWWAHGRATRPVIDWLSLALTVDDRPRLHQRIAQRFSTMLQDGLLAELDYLRKTYTLDADMPSMRCVGYRQAWAFQQGQSSRDELLARGIYATRQLAKRQLTWLRGMHEAERFDCFSPNLIAQLSQRIADWLRT